VRAVIQRVTSAHVTVGTATIGAIGPGVAVLVGIAASDGSSEADWMAARIATLRIFADAEGKLNRSLLDVGGEALVVSQFTVYGDARKGRRPSFIRAAQGPRAETLYARVVERLSARGITCATGSFGATMQVALVNDGPVTLLLDSDKLF
jgi:D-aminoacyl-tRNA deacylase